MLSNYLKIALRSLIKHKSYAAINILGLAVGIACCLLMLLTVRHEFSYDRFHRHASRIYRVVTHSTTAPSTVASPIRLAPTLAREFPEIAHAVRFGRAWPGVMRYEDKKYQEANIFFADPEIFAVFDLPLLQGHAATALQKPNGIVITTSAAQKYFGAENPLGRTLAYSFEGTQEFEITGVAREMPSHSHFQFDFLLPLASQKDFVEGMGADWKFNFIPTYVLLAEHAEAASVSERFHDFVARHYPAKLNSETTLSLQALTDIHLHSQYDGELDVNGSMRLVWFYASLAALILLLACINFMNLATARAADRAKEVGVRKSMGAQRGQLLQQFFGEAMLMSFIAVALALTLAELLLPLFNDLTGKSLIVLGPGAVALVAMLLGLGLVVGIIAGSYPAFFLSAFEPVAVLKGKGAKTQGGARRLRKALVVGQFAVSIFFLIGVMVMQRQLEFVQNRPLGYQKEEIVFIRSPQREERMNFELYRNELKAVPGVIAVTGASAIPGSGQNFGSAQVHAEGMPADARIELSGGWVEHDFAATFGLRLVAGRDFSPSFSTDPTEALLINETAIAALGWSASANEAIGKRIALFRPDRPEPIFTGRVIGVVRDFHFQSLYQPVKPMFLTCRPVFNRTYIALRIQSENLASTLAGLERAWKKLASEWPLELSFLDAATAAIYDREQRARRAFLYATLLAGFVAGLGLFGLAAYATQQRTKEIGIRKVLGASAASIVISHSKESIKLILLANLIAWPLAYFVMNSWLQNFAYRMNMSVWIFALAGGLALLLTALTVSTQAVRAACANPVEALREE